MSTKEQLQAANERLGAEVAALRELLTVIGTALPPWPADTTSTLDHGRYQAECRSRLAAVAIIADSAMDYAGQTAFTDVLRNSAGSLRKELAKPLRYQPETAEPVAVPA